MVFERETGFYDKPDLEPVSNHIQTGFVIKPVFKEVVSETKP